MANYSINLSVQGNREHAQMLQSAIVQFASQHGIHVDVELLDPIWLHDPGKLLLPRLPLANDEITDGPPEG